MPQEYVIGGGYFEKWSNEFRVSTPVDQPLRATFGFFIQRQLHNIWQQYSMPGYGFTNVQCQFGQTCGNPAGFATYFSIPNLDNTIWLTDEQRVDRDKAVFIQADWDISPQWTLTGGYRHYKYDNSLQGFFGFSENYFSTPGMGACFTGAQGLPSTKYAPCTNLQTEVSDTGSVPKVTLTYKPTKDALIYATYSKGFRPGGVNRVAGPNGPPYQADFLKNYEIGWKTQWFNHRLRWNGALFKQDWNNFQFSFLVPPSITAVGNGGNATIKGLENELEWAATDHLLVSTSFTFLDPVLTQNYCGTLGVTDCPTQQTYYAFNFPGAVPQPGGQYMWIGPLAPSGTNLPVAPKFKGNVVMRYTFVPIHDWAPFGQAAFVYQTQTSPNLIVPSSLVIGNMPAYGVLDLSAGADNGKTGLQLFISNVTDKRAQLSRFTETNPQVDNTTYIAPTQPRTISLNFWQRF
jgi:outer membrane receptor protein involved in Fe transport